VHITFRHGMLAASDFCRGHVPAGMCGGNSRLCPGSMAPFAVRRHLALRFRRSRLANWEALWGLHT